MTFDEVLNAARRLNWDEQTLLVHLLQEELRLEIEATPLTAEQIAELDRRINDIQDHPDAGVPWEEVLSAARQRLKGKVVE